MGVTKLKINLKEKLSKFSDHWSPKIIAAMNGAIMAWSVMTLNIPCIQETTLYHTRYLNVVKLKKFYLKMHRIVSPAL